MMTCKQCGHDRWDEQGVTARCSYCHYILTEQEYAQTHLSDSHAFSYLSKQLEQKNIFKRALAKGFQKNPSAFIISILMAVMLLGSFGSLFFMAGSEKSFEKLESRVKAVQVIGLTAEQATKEIRKIDKEAHITYYEEGFFINSETTDLSKIVKKLTVDYDYNNSSHNVELLLVSED